MFKTEKLKAEHKLKIRADIDSISFVTGSLSRVAHVFQKSSNKCRLELSSKLNVIKNKTSKSRWNIRTEKKTFNPTIFNTEKNKFRFQSAPNIQIAKMYCDNIPYSISIVLLDDNAISSSAINHKQLHAIYFLMNVVIAHPDWFKSPYDDQYWERYLPEFVSNIKNLERVGSQSKESNPTTQHLDGDTGIVFLTLLESAIFTIANNANHDVFCHPNNEMNEIYHFRYHQNTNNKLQDKDICMKEIFDTLQYFAKNMVFTCVAAGTKDQFKRKSFCFNFNQRGRIHNKMQEESKILLQDLQKVLVFDDDEFVKDNAYLFQTTNLTLQIDIGFEFNLLERDQMLYPSGEIAQDIVKVSVDQITKFEDESFGGSDDDDDDDDEPEEPPNPGSDSNSNPITLLMTEQTMRQEMVLDQIQAWEIFLMMILMFMETGIHLMKAMEIQILT